MSWTPFLAIFTALATLISLILLRRKAITPTGLARYLTAITILTILFDQAAETRALWSIPDAGPSVLDVPLKNVLFLLSISLYSAWFHWLVLRFHSRRRCPSTRRSN